MKRIFIIAMFLLNATIVIGQTIIKDRIDDQQVSQLLKSLDKKIEDSIRIGMLLKIAEHNLEKEGYEKADLDSAAIFIKNAREINAKQNNLHFNGLILIYESDLTRKLGDTILARQLINQAIKLLQTTNDELHLTQAYLELSRCYDLNIPEQTVAINNVFNTLFERLQKLVGRELPIDEDGLNTFLLELVSFYNLKMRADNFSVLLNFLVHLQELCKILNSKLAEFWARKEIADIHYKQGKFKIAIDELLVIANDQKAGGYPQLCFTYDLLSGLYFASSNYDKALYYSLETIKNVRTAKDSFYLGNFYARVAVSYGFTGSVAESLSWNLKRLNYLIFVNKTYSVYAIMYDMTIDLINLGRAREALEMVLEKSKTITPNGHWERRAMLLSLAKSYAALKDYNNAERYNDELSKLIEKRIRQKEITSDYTVYQHLAGFYFSVGQYAKAETYFKSAIQEFPQTLTNVEAQYVHNFLFKLDSVKADYLPAIKHLQAAQIAKDSLFTAAKVKQIEELKITYETAQKDSLINLKEQNIQLLTKEDKLQKSKLQQGIILRNISFAVVTLLFIIVGLLYNRYRLKQRTNQKLELQQLEIAKQNDSLQHLLTEKDWLLKEIHHRVKNNLQIVMSLLNSQSAYINNEAALTAIHDSQHRVHAMSLIHQKLYSSESVSSIDMSLYIRELVSYLSDSFDTSRRIRFDLNIEPLQMDVSQAVPLGLILNEAITNSIKYAFPDDRSSLISISLSKTSADRFSLIISDNGIGMPSDIKKSGSLGLSLMKGLSEDIDGDLSIENRNGTFIELSFVYDPAIKRPNILAPSFVSNN
jgi:two-component sensor histidine kinase